MLFVHVGDFKEILVFNQLQNNFSMSLLNSIVKIYLNREKRKNSLREVSFEEKQAQIFSEPPLKIAKKGDFEKIEIKGAKAIWCNKANSNKGVLVFLHGGSYTSGPYREHWEYFTDICRRTVMAGLLIDYKLAPNNPFPAGLNDVITILQNLDLQNFFLLGDSAGAGLSVATCYKLKGLGEKLPQKLILMSGWFDLTLENPALKINAEADVMLTYENLGKSAKVYIGGETPKNPLISPIYGDVSVLPPTLIQIGTNDMLLWDNRKFYLKCLEANIEVKYEEYEKTFHDFMLVGFLPEAKKARKSQTAFLLNF
jgi:epsilon-lactone hydrolase